MADASEYTDASRLIHTGPCIVKNVFVNYTGASSAAALIYDGKNANGTLKAKISAGPITNGDWTPGQGTDFHNGIYVTVGTGIVVTVTYVPESRKAII